MTAPAPDLRDLSPAELTAWLTGRGHPRYRADQIMDGLYRHGVERVEDIRNLPGALSRELEAYRLALPRETRRLTSGDGSVKLGLTLADGELVETVWMPEDDGRATLCVSSQAGCRMACRFCRTGRGGFRRHLTPAEIVGQVMVADRGLGPVRNLVFMGMGEPLDNLDHLLRALAILGHQRGLGFGPRRLTVSTIGDPQQLERFGRLAPPVNLAVSLHSAVADTRNSLLPAAAARDLVGLHRALESRPRAERDRLTLEVVLVGGVNDTIAEARAVADWSEGLPIKVNLIRFNPFPDSGLQAPREEAVLAYQAYLRGRGIPAFIRRSRGADILAACGQLWGE